MRVKKHSVMDMMIYDRVFLYKGIQAGLPAK
jgi:hypothetical protein